MLRRCHFNTASTSTICPKTPTTTRVTPHPFNNNPLHTKVFNTFNFHCHSRNKVNSTRIAKAEAAAATIVKSKGQHREYTLVF